MVLSVDFDDPIDFCNAQLFKVFLTTPLGQYFSRLISIIITTSSFRNPLHVKSSKYASESVVWLDISLMSFVDQAER